MKRILIAAICVLLITTVLFSCGRRSAEALAEKMIEKVAAREGEDVDIDLSGETMSIKDSEGNTVSIGGGELPDGWPQAVPFDRDLEIVFAGASRSADKGSWTVNAASGSEPDKIFEDYKRDLSGWTISNEMAMDSSGMKSYTLQAEDGQYRVNLFVSGEGEGSSVILGVEEL